MTNLTTIYIGYITMVKGDDLTWEDFEKFPHEEIGSGLYIREYNIIGGGDLLIGGPSLDEEPWYIEIIDLDGDRYRIKG